MRDQKIEYYTTHMTAERDASRARASSIHLRGSIERVKLKQRLRVTGAGKS